MMTVIIEGEAKRNFDTINEQESSSNAYSLMIVIISTMRILKEKAADNDVEEQPCFSED